MMNRKVLWFTVLMVFMNMIITAVAQNLPCHPPFVQEGKVWEVSKYYRQLFCDEWGRLHYSNPVKQFTCTYTMRGDSLVGDNVMKRVYRRDKGFYNDEEEHYFAAVREEGSRVFIIYDKRDDELCLYDFRPEDECENMVFVGLCNRSVEGYPQNVDLTVGRDEYAFEDTVVINGYHTRRFFAFKKALFHNYPSGERYLYDECLMLEGYGLVHTDPFDISVWADASYTYACYAVMHSEQYLVGNYVEVSPCCLYVPQEVEHVYVNDVLIASSWDFSRVTTAVEFVGQKEDSPVFYDLQGRRLTTEPERGVYIKDGRKYVRTRDY